MESTSHVSFFRMVLSCRVTTGWIFESSLCEISINQSMMPTKMSNQVSLLLVGKRITHNTYKPHAHTHNTHTHDTQYYTYTTIRAHPQYTYTHTTHSHTNPHTTHEHTHTHSVSPVLCLITGFRNMYHRSPLGRTNASGIEGLA